MSNASLISKKSAKVSQKSEARGFDGEEGLGGVKVSVEIRVEVQPDKLLARGDRYGVHEF